MIRRKEASTLIFLTILFSTMIFSINFHAVRGEGPIVINANGNVEGTDKILRSGNMYTLIGNIEVAPQSGGAIRVLKDNITIDGAQFTIHSQEYFAGELFWDGGYNSGIDLSGRKNVKVQNTQINGFYQGITFNFTENSSAINNSISNCNIGIKLDSSKNINITANVLSETSSEGVETSNCDKIIITQNDIANCGYGISTSGLSQSAPAGLKGSSGLRISNNNITRNKRGIDFVWTQASAIFQNHIEMNNHGINAVGSRGNNITENIFVGNTEGAVRISGAQNNTFYHNNFINNTSSEGIQIYNPWLVLGNPEDNIWDNGFEGNYWSDFKQRYPNASEIPGTGIWDTCYHINEKNIDHHALVNPYRTEIESRQELLPAWIIVAAVVLAATIGVAFGVRHLVKAKKKLGKT